jgi:hypothetical protein
MVHASKGASVNFNLGDEIVQSTKKHNNYGSTGVCRMA